MPNATSNTMVLRARAASGSKPAATDTQPSQVRWLKRNGRNIVLKAHPSNTIPVTITFNQAAANQLFAAPVPVSPVVLDAAGATATFILKASLGIQQRSNPQDNFEDEDPKFVRTFNFEHEPGDAGGGEDHNPFHFEC